MSKFDEVERCIPQPRLCGQMRLWELPDQLVFQPTDVRQLLSINRASGAPSLINEVPLSNNEMSLQTLVVYGIIGAVKLLAGLHVLVITGRECIGAYRGHPVFRVTSMKFVQCRSDCDLSTHERREEAQFVSLLKIAESTPGLYFSYEVDLTRNTQISHDPSKVQRMDPLWRQADRRLLWNRNLLQFLIDAKMEPFILPVIQGSFQKKQVLVKDKFLDITLISRRSVDRIGTRMWRRGADLNGNVANFVETEQILEADGFLASYVLVRGSIPVLWEQIVDLSYKPPMSTISPNLTPTVVERHFEYLSDKYGSVLAVDLINQHGLEGVLSVAYKNAVSSLQSDKLKYVPFDFHRVCGQVRFERLSNLHDQIAEQLMKQGFYLVNPAGEVTQTQKGVVRTNCIDCLDRVNVTQSLIARKAIEAQLRSVGFLKQQETIEQHPVLDKALNHIWANLGDDLSIQYAGTPALKGDFVRYGRRTIGGFIQDGISALYRYYLNNFRDGVRQDSMDLVAGHYQVVRGKPSPFQLGLRDIFTCLPFVVTLIVVFFIGALVSLGRADEDPRQLFYTLMWATLTSGVVSAVRLNGRQFCNRPRLCNLV